VTNDELNRAVAVFLGAKVVYHKAQWSPVEGYKLWQLAKAIPGQEDRIPSTCWQENGLYITEECAWSQVHDFCKDARATELVIQDIERRGWWWDMSYRDTSDARKVLPRYCFVIHATELEQAAAEDEEGELYRRADSRGRAVCLAFVAACEAVNASEGAKAEEKGVA
jgi:hypothetical protein